MYYLSAHSCLGIFQDGFANEGPAKAATSLFNYIGKDFETSMRTSETTTSQIDDSGGLEESEDEESEDDLAMGTAEMAGEEAEPPPDRDENEDEEEDEDS